MIPVACNIIGNLVLQLGKLAAQEVKQIMEVEDEAESLSKELRLFEAFLRDSEGIINPKEQVTELLLQIKEVVFKAEDIIEILVLNIEMQLKMNPLSRVINKGLNLLDLRDLAKQIKSINGEIKRVYDKKEVYMIDKMGVNGGGGSTNPRLEELLRKRRMEVEEMEVVGFDDVAETLLKQLIGGSRHLQIVSIVGMGGLGKTTVAKKLYNDRVIKDHFPSCRGWSFVSEDYNLRQVIIDLLKTMLRVKIRVSSKTKTDELKQALTQSLQGRKYVVFLDDIWKTEMWDDIRLCFPNDSKYGSRVVITTRDAKVAKHATRNPPPYMLRKLNPKESWDLFCNKVFRGEPCPPNLIEIGQKIAYKCDGLPLAIVVLGSMLAVEEQTVSRWTHMVDYVSSLVNEKQECSEILKLSYRHLPRQLKPCFLYFAAFPEDYEMNVRRLIAMWIAEGFIQSNSSQPLVLVAERCLEMLIDRSLVQIGERRTDGGVKTCRIHDLLRDLCIKEAQTESFLTTSTYLFSPSQGLANNMPRRVSSVHLHTPEIIKQGKVRKKGTTLPVRSLISFDKEGNLPETSWKVLTNNFKLLRVLDLGSSIWNFSVPDSISNLGNLRYLRLRILKSCFPSSSIFKLWNLQVLIIEGDYTFTLSDGLYRMHQLQRLVLRLPCTLSRPPSQSTRKPLKALEVMASVVPTETLEALVKGGMFPSITKLALTGTKDQKPWTLLPYLRHLPRLQTLKIIRHSFLNNDCLFQGEIYVPATLTKITLISSILTQNTFDVLGKVPNLQVLKVYSTVQGSASSLRFNQSSFRKLHTLNLKKVPDLKQLQIVEVEDTLSLLRHLLVRQCTNLRHISPKLFQLTCLQVVEVLQANKMLSQKLHNLEHENKVKCRLLVHTL